MNLKTFLRRGAVACLAILPVIAAEYHGQVKFNGLPLPGASITATQGEKQLSSVSDPQGVYSFPDLPDGTWQLQAEMMGFSPAKQEVTAGTGLPGASFELKMLPLDQIQATVAPAPPVVAAPASSVSTATTPPVPASAPLPSIKAANGTKAATGKNAAPATLATAFQRTDLNASAAPAPATAEPAPEVTSELNQRAADGFLVNGSSQNGAASPYAQNPAFGNNRKGGPHLYTGSLALVESNSGLDAAPYSLTGQSSRTPFNLLTGSVNVGGPIRIPHLLVKPMGQGPMFVLNYQRIENRNSSVTPALMPNAAERQGNFSQVFVSGQPVQIFNPATGAPFANNTIPASLLNPQALALLQLYPQPNFSGSSVYNFQIPLVGNTHTDNFNLRINEAFKRKNFISGIIAASNTRSDSNSDLNFLDLTHSLGLNSNISYRRSFTPRFYGTVTVTYSRFSTQSFPFFANTTNVSGAAGITGNNQEPVNWGPPTLSFEQSGLGMLSDTNASTSHNQTSAIGYLGTWNRGRHNIQFGGDFRWQQFNTIAQSNPRGAFTFTGGVTQQMVNGVPVPGTGYDFADFLLGTPDQSAIAYGNADKYLRAKQPDLFFTDDWKISPGLSLSLGLRWEYTSPITEEYGRLVNLDVAPGFASVAPVVASAPVGPLTGTTYPASLIRPDKHEFRPLPAFAWRPFPASSMVVRGGYGISYNTRAYNGFANLMDQQYPLSKSLQVVNSTKNPLSLANGFYAPANVATNTIAVDPNFKIGYAQVWNLSVQRDLPWSLVMLATYTGTKGTHLLQEFVPNTYPAGAVIPCSACPSDFTYYTSNGNSTREAGSFDLRRRLHNGVQAEVTYTYSKSIDDAAVLGGGGSLGSPAQNWLDLEGERGPSTFDQRHLVNLNLQYTSGMGMGGGTLLSGWRGRVIKDWTFVDQITLGSGLPLTPVYGHLIGSVSGNVRANYTGVPLYAAPPGDFLNPLAVSAPVTGQWGDAGVGSIRGPNQFSMNSSMARTFRLNDRFNLDLRVDANNSLNRVVFGSVVTSTTSTQFGTLVNPNQMRRLVLTLRLHF